MIERLYERDRDLYKEISEQLGIGDTKSQIGTIGLQISQIRKHLKLEED